MIIDAHAHLWRRKRTPQPWIDPDTMSVIDRDFWLDELRAVQAATGIAGTVLVQSSNSAAETRDLLTLVDGSAVRGIVGWVDLERDVPAQLFELGPGLVGVRHLVHQDPDAEWLQRPNVSRGLDALGVAGIPFDLVVSPEQLELAVHAAAHHPHTSFVLDHLGKPPLAGGVLPEWRVTMAALAAHSNVTAKLSGLVVEADRATWGIDDLIEPVEFALGVFGVDRVMFGSDWPVVDLAGGISRWMAAVDVLLGPVGEKERNGIMAQNALRVYRLERTDA